MARLEREWANERQKLEESHQDQSRKRRLRGFRLVSERGQIGFCGREGRDSRLFALITRKEGKRLKAVRFGWTAFYFAFSEKM